MTSDFRRKQWFIAATSVPAFVVVGATLYFAHSWFSFATMPADTTDDRLVFVLQWLLLPGAMLWIGVQFAGRRWLYPDAIEGSRFPQNHGLEINLRYNTNTLEQFVLAAVAYVNLALVLDREYLILIPAMASLFVVGRITFWTGYLWRPVARGFGMILTALPTAGSFVWLLAHWTMRFV